MRARVFAFQPARAIPPRDHLKDGLISVAASASAWNHAVPIEHRAADERLLAFARVIGAAVIVLAAAINPEYSTAVDVLVVAYCAHAAIVALVGWAQSDWLVRHVGVLHVVDMGWAVAITALTGGPSGNTFSVFMFPLLASIFRWGLSGGIRDALIILAVVVAHWVATILGFATSTPFQAELVIIRMAYISIGIGLLFAVVLQRQHALSYQALFLAEIVAKVSHASKLDSAIKDVLTRVLQHFGARHALLVIEESENGALQRWRADAREAGSVFLTHVAIPREERRDWVFGAPEEIGACELERPEGAGTHAIVAANLDPERRANDVPVRVPVVIGDASAWQSLLAVPIAITGVWKGQFYLLDPARGRHPELRLRFLQAIAQQVGPALVNLYLLRRLRSRAESIERGRLSRELHDGALPAIVGLEMRVEALCRSTVATAPDIAADLLEIRDQLHDEALNLRAVTQRLRSAEIDARQLPGELADHVTRFGRASGIDARFEWTVDDLQLTPHQCTEIVRIVQEGLFNIRRHSAATKVVVRVEGDACSWILVIADNGQGLGFNGRLADEQLKASHRGPRVIHERVAALGGTLDIESSPGGTRLEITFAREPAA